MKLTPSTVQPTPAEQAANVQPLDPPDEDVLLSLGIEPGKKPRATRRTLLTIFEADPRWAGRVRLDRFRDSIVVDGDGLTDRDVTRIACWIEAVYDVNPSRDLMVECEERDRRRVVESDHGEQFDDVVGDAKVGLPCLSG